MKTTSLITLLSVPLLAAALFVNVFANEAEHASHTGDAGKKMEMPVPMQEKMKAMQAEMQAIIDTEDTEKRKALFADHKKKMHGMMGMMHANCAKHKEKHDAAHVHKEGDAHKEGDKH